MHQIFPSSSEPLGPAEPLRAGPPIKPGDPAAAGLIDKLAEIYAYPEGTWVRANMITSVDGSIAVQGRSGGLSGPADRLVFGVLRSLADVIVVGAGTARAEKYGLAKPASMWPQLRSGRAATPPIAVVTRSLHLDLDSELIHGERGQLPRTIVLTTRQAPADQLALAAKTADVIVTGDSDVSATDIRHQLSGLGYHRILIEGGPSLLGDFAAAGLLDELCITTSPMLAGGNSRLLVADLATPVPLKLAASCTDDGFVLSRYTR